jgi:hypothetical protein
MDDSFDLELAAASLRADQTDVHVLLKVLCEQLGDALGSRLTVERAGGRFRKSDEVKSLRIALGDDQFEAVVEGSGLRCSIGHTSGGIRIRSESVDTDQWTTRLLATLEVEAAHSQSTRQALENIVIGRQS